MQGTLPSGGGHESNGEPDLVKAALLRFPENAQKTQAKLQEWRELLVGLGLSMLRVMTIVPELALRPCHGLRSLSPMVLLLALASFWVVGFGDLIPFAGGSAPGFIGWIGLPATVGLYVLRRIQASRAFRRGELWHSRLAMGTYLPVGTLPWLLDSEWRAVKFAEPLLLVGLGLALRFVLGTSVGTYLMLCGVALHLKCVLLESRERDRLLDLLDQQIEMERMSGAVEQRPPQEEDHGWIVPIPLPAAS